MIMGFPGTTKIILTNYFLVRTQFSCRNTSKTTNFETSLIFLNLKLMERIHNEIKKNKLSLKMYLKYTCVVVRVFK